MLHVCISQTRHVVGLGIHNLWCNPIRVPDKSSQYFWGDNKEPYFIILKVTKITSLLPCICLLMVVNGTNAVV